MRLQWKTTGTIDRGDGEADLEGEPPTCPDHCGGDAYIYKHDFDNPTGEVWKCCDCAGQWNGWSEEIDGE